MSKRKRADTDESGVESTDPDFPNPKRQNRSSQPQSERDDGAQKDCQGNLSSNSTDGAAENQYVPTFLGIPGEIRNLIYEYCLVEEDDIVIDDNNHSEPGLLRSCRQVREEASEIFYEDNDFFIRIWDLELKPRIGHWLWRKATCVDIEHEGVNSWSNFKDLLRQYWVTIIHNADTGTSKEELARPGSDEGVVEAAFDIVDTLAAVNTPWSVVEDVLEAFKTAMVEDIFASRVRWV